MGKGFLVAFVSLSVFFLAGCGGKSSSESFLRQDVELGYVNRIAVVPFENHTKDEFAAERARNVTITQVLAMGLFDVVDKGLVDSALREEAIEPGVPLDKPTLKRLGQRLNVQALMLGAVDQAEEGRKGSFAFPEVSLTLRLVEAQAAMILWQASGHNSGYTLWGRLFGLAPRDAFRISLELVRDLLSTLPERSDIPSPAPAEAGGA